MAKEKAMVLASELIEEAPETAGILIASVDVDPTDMEHAVVRVAVMNINPIGIAHVLLRVAHECMPAELRLILAEALRDMSEQKAAEETLP